MELSWISVPDYNSLDKVFLAYSTPSEAIFIWWELWIWPPGVKNWLILKDPDAGKDWRQEERWMTGWDGWMASPTRWTWVWASSGSWWWTGKPGVQHSMESQRVRHDWVTEMNKAHELPWWLSGKESTCNAVAMGSVPQWVRCTGGGHGNPFQLSCLENPHGQRSLVGYSP